MDPLYFNGLISVTKGGHEKEKIRRRRISFNFSVLNNTCGALSLVVVVSVSYHFIRCTSNLVKCVQHAMYQHVSSEVCPCNIAVSRNYHCNNLLSCSLYQSTTVEYRSQLKVMTTCQSSFSIKCMHMDGQLTYI